MENILGIITARCGSKGIKDKNIRSLNGKPLLAYSIKAAQDSGIFACIHLSTDSEEYATIGRQYGADVPFLREEKLADDLSDSWDVVRWTIKKYKSLKREFDTVVLLQPTSPLRSKEDIIGAYNLYKEKNAKSVVSVCEVDHSPLWCNTLDSNMSMKDFLSKGAQRPRQELPVYYRLNGAIYLIEVNHLMNGFFLYDDNCFAYIMNKNNSIDIDDEMDFFIAQQILNEGNF